MKRFLWFLRYSLTAAMLTLSLGTGPVALAEGITTKFTQVACKAGLTSCGGGASEPGQLIVTVGSFINVILGLMGTVFVGYIIYGGFSCMTARGNSQQVEEAEHLIRNAVIGIVVIF